MAPAIDFYYTALSPPSRAVWMVLEELGVNYTAHPMDLGKGDQKTNEYRKINLRQKVPGLKDGDVCLGESRAISCYLVSEYGARCKKQDLYPPKVGKQAVINQHLYITENIFEQIFAFVNVGGVMFGNGLTKYDKIDEAKKALTFIEGLLTDHAYTAADNFTIADIFYYLAVSMLDVTDYNDWADYPKIVAWKKKMVALPYHKKTCEDPGAKFRAMYQEKLKENTEKQQKS